MVDVEAKDWLNGLVPNVISLAHEAGNAILKVYDEMDTAVEYKRDDSPLTQADLISHQIIEDGLAELTAEFPVLSEESREIPFSEREKWGYFWLVDPLDGTKEFLKRNGEFTVNIALIRDGAPILGVVYAPAIEKLYYGARGSGSFKEEGGKLSPIHVANFDAGTVRVVISRSHGSGEENLERFTGGAPCEFVSMGSSLKFCLIAEGSADVYPRTGPTMEWDTAAAQCVVEQAGGTVTDLDGRAMVYNKPILLNPGFVASCSKLPSAAKQNSLDPVSASD
jgi:3'(2'), 5'-bisphosphate nucleotidase